jgi:hypothetical protein
MTRPLKEHFSHDKGAFISAHTRGKRGFAGACVFCKEEIQIENLNNVLESRKQKRPRIKCSWALLSIAANLYGFDTPCYRPLKTLIRN